MVGKTRGRAAAAQGYCPPSPSGHARGRCRGCRTACARRRGSSSASFPAEAQVNTRTADCERPENDTRGPAPECAAPEAARAARKRPVTYTRAHPQDGLLPADRLGVVFRGRPDCFGGRPCPCRFRGDCMSRQAPALQPPAGPRGLRRAPRSCMFRRRARAGERTEHDTAAELMPV